MEQKVSFTAVGMQNGTATLEERQTTSYTTRTLLVCYPAFMFLVIYSKESKTYVHITPCTQMFIEALVIIFYNLEANTMSLSR